MLTTFMITTPFATISAHENDSKENNTVLTTYDWQSAESSHGEVKKDANFNGEEIQLVGEGNTPITHETGIGTVADSTVIYDVPSGYEFFESYVGIDFDENDESARVKFSVYLDDELAVETEEIHAGMPQEKLHVPLNEASQLKLVVTNIGEAENLDESPIHISWGSPILIKQAETPDPIKPIIYVQDHVYAIGEAINLSELATAKDAEGNDLTNTIEITTEYEPGHYGEFPVTYSVTDEDGNEQSVTIQIYVPEPITKLTNQHVQDLDEIFALNASIYNSLHEMGFTDEHIEMLAALPKRETSFYETLEHTQKPKSQQTKASVKIATLTNSSPATDTIGSRISYVTSLLANHSTLKVGTEEFNKEIVYLYLSHYVDNPFYPSFTNCLCDQLVEQDRDVYERYIQTGTPLRNANNVMQMVNSAVSLIQSSQNIKRELTNIDNILKNILTLYKNYTDSETDIENLEKYANEFVKSFTRNYESAVNTESLIRAVEEDLVQKDIAEPIIKFYTDAVFSSFSSKSKSHYALILSGSTVYLETVKNLADRAALNALKYTTSLRITLRQYASW